jgi:hypothetical protein
MLVELHILKMLSVGQNKFRNVKVLQNWWSDTGFDKLYDTFFRCKFWNIWKLKKLHLNWNTYGVSSSVLEIQRFCLVTTYVTLLDFTLKFVTKHYNFKTAKWYLYICKAIALERFTFPVLVSTIWAPYCFYANVSLRDIPSVYPTGASNEGC